MGLQYAYNLNKQELEHLIINHKNAFMLDDIQSVNNGHFYKVLLLTNENEITPNLVSRVMDTYRQEGYNARHTSVFSLVESHHLLDKHNGMSIIETPLGLAISYQNVNGTISGITPTISTLYLIA